MSEKHDGPQLPERASLEYLKRVAKERLAELRREEPRAKLATAQLAVARQYGFSSWRALKGELDARRAPELKAFFDACRAGDVEALKRLVPRQPSLVHERSAEGSTGLHLAVSHEDAVRFLLERGADPNARDAGDNASALHLAAGIGASGSVRALLDAGGDVHGEGDLHRSGVIGWATLYASSPHMEVLELLLAHGARHHIFSAIATCDAELVDRIVEENPAALTSRLSRFEQGQTPLHYVVAAPDGISGGGFRTGKHYEILNLLIELGADLEAEDDKGRTPLTLAMLRGDEEAMRRLHAAGARVPERSDGKAFDTRRAALAASVKKLDPMIAVSDVKTSLAWYQSIGFEIESTHENDGVIDWAGLSLGGASVMLVPAGSKLRSSGVTFWLRTDRIDDLYAALQQRQLERTSRVLTGVAPDAPEVRFAEDIYDTHYGARIFSILDPDGYSLIFIRSS